MKKFLFFYSYSSSFPSLRGVQPFHPSAPHPFQERKRKRRRVSLSRDPFSPKANGACMHFQRRRRGLKIEFSLFCCAFGKANTGGFGPGRDRNTSLQKNKSRGGGSLLRSFGVKKGERDKALEVRPRLTKEKQSWPGATQGGKFNDIFFSLFPFFPQE